MASHRSVVTTNINFLQQGINILDSISDKDYVFVDEQYHKSGIGTHMRHVLDHYENLLCQWKSGYINYEDRKREITIEKNRIQAINRCNELIKALEKLRKDEPDLQDFVIKIKTDEGEQDSPESCRSVTTLKRELHFLISHTVHHYAFIGVILRIQGLKFPDKFGLAPSTLKYQSQETAHF